YIYLLASGGDAQTELLIIQRFTRNWSGLLKGIAIASVVSGITGSVNSYVRKLGFKSLRAKKLYSSGRVTMVLMSLAMFIFLVLKVDFALFGLIFLSVIFGWLLQLFFIGYYSFLKNL